MSILGTENRTEDRRGPRVDDSDAASLCRLTEPAIYEPEDIKSTSSLKITPSVYNLKKWRRRSVVN